MLQVGNNEIILTLIGNDTSVFMKSATVEIRTTPENTKNWLLTLSDTTPLSEINLPGTHDSASINTLSHSVYACHSESITQQLNGGIRILDIRLKVKKNE